MIDPDAFGLTMGAIVKEAVEPLKQQLAALEARPPLKGEPGVPGPKGEAGQEGRSVTMADVALMMDAALSKWSLEFERRSSDLLGKALGAIRQPLDGKDGVSFDSFELEYLAETHEMCVRATAGGRTKELRYPAGGIRPGGYWREGVKALAGQTWTHEGSLWIARQDTSVRPSTQAEKEWQLGARHGRDGEPSTRRGAPVVGTIALRS